MKQSGAFRNAPRAIVLKWNRVTRILAAFEWIAILSEHGVGDAAAHGDYVDGLALRRSACRTASCVRSMSPSSVATSAVRASFSTRSPAS